MSSLHFYLSPLLMSSPISSSTLRFFSPKLSLLPIKPPSLSLSSPISFQRHSTPSPHQPIRAHSPSPSPSPEKETETEVDPSLLPPPLLTIIALFQSVPDPKAKYLQLLHYARQLPPLDPQFKTDAHRVRGCVSQVWLRAYPDPADPAKVRFEADSDSALTKGLAALLVLGLSGSPPSAIASVPPAFVHLLGLRQSLTPSRNNGFLNMLRLMQQKALELEGSNLGSGSVEIGVLEGEDASLDQNGSSVTELESSNSITREVVGVNGSSGSADNGILEGKYASLDQNGEREVLGANCVLNGKDAGLDQKGDGIDGVLEVEGGDEEEAGVVQPGSGGGLGGRAERIREALEKELSPVELVLEDISHRHAGHAGVRGSRDGETHFNLRVVSKEFEGKSLVKRHRLVYSLLQEELQSGLHALSIDAKTPSEV